MNNIKNSDHKANNNDNNFFLQLIYVVFSSTKTFCWRKLKTVVKIGLPELRIDHKKRRIEQFGRNIGLVKLSQKTAKKYIAVDIVK